MVNKTSGSECGPLCYFVIDRARDQRTEYRQNVHGEVRRRAFYAFSPKGQKSSPLALSKFDECAPFFMSILPHPILSTMPCPPSSRLFTLSTHFRFLSLNYAISRPRPRESCEKIKAKGIEHKYAWLVVKDTRDEGHQNNIDLSCGQSQLPPNSRHASPGCAMSFKAVIPSCNSFLYLLTVHLSS